MKSNAVGTLEGIVGEDISFGLRSLSYLPLDAEDIPENYIDEPYDGTETVTCMIKKATRDLLVPKSDIAAVLEITPVFVAGVGAVVAYWLFTIDAGESVTLNPDMYITDAKVVYQSGVVNYPRPILIDLKGHVTS